MRISWINMEIITSRYRFIKLGKSWYRRGWKRKENAKGEKSKRRESEWICRVVAFFIHKLILPRYGEENLWKVLKFYALHVVWTCFRVLKVEYLGSVEAFFYRAMGNKRLTASEQKETPGFQFSSGWYWFCQ